MDGWFAFHNIIYLIGQLFLVVYNSVFWISYLLMIIYPKLSVCGFSLSYHKCTFDAVNGGMMTWVDHRSNFLTERND